MKLRGIKAVSFSLVPQRMYFHCRGLSTFSRTQREIKFIPLALLCNYFKPLKKTKTVAKTTKDLKIVIRKITTQVPLTSKQFSIQNPLTVNRANI